MKSMPIWAQIGENGGVMVWLPSRRPVLKTHWGQQCKPSNFTDSKDILQAFYGYQDWVFLHELTGDFLAFFLVTESSFKDVITWFTLRSNRQTKAILNKVGGKPGSCKPIVGLNPSMEILTGVKKKIVFFHCSSGLLIIPLFIQVSFKTCCIREQPSLEVEATAIHYHVQ